MKSARFAAGAAGWTCLLLLLGSTAAQPQPASPPPPDKYKAVIRYHIPALRDEHVVRYKAMVEHLASIGFDFQPPLRPFPNTDYEDRSKNMLTGFIKSDKALLCLAD